jgi:O-methyltransferase domain/Dimerisation domain
MVADGESTNWNDASALPSPEQIRQLYQIMGGHRVAQALYVVAKLGIADLLKDGLLSSDQLARATGTDEPALYRLLRFLTGAGLFHEEAPRHFALTALSAGLRADVPGSLRANVLMQLDEPHWAAWSQLLYSVRSGKTAFGHVHGAEFFDYLARHGEPAAVFQQAMTSNTARSGAAITRAYDFSGVRRIVDVGGGHGLFLATILQSYPAMRGVLFDQPEVVQGAAAALEMAGVADRCEIAAGDFFAAVPPGGDAYLLRQIIHDWDDAQAITILTNCRRAMHESGKVLVVERALAADHREALGALHLDMEMLANLGGLQRTDAEYGVLFEAAGLRPGAIVPLGDTDQFSVFEGISFSTASFGP